MGTDAYNAAVGANIWQNVTHTIEPKGTGYTIYSYMNGEVWIPGVYNCTENLLGYTNFNVGSCNTEKWTEGLDIWREAVPVCTECNPGSVYIPIWEISHAHHVYGLPWKLPCWADSALQV